MIPVIVDDDATGAVAVQFDGCNAIVVASVTESRVAPMWVTIGRPVSSTDSVFSAYLAAMGVAFPLVVVYVLAVRVTNRQNITAGHRPFMTRNALTVESCAPTRQNMNHPACAAGKIPPAPFTKGS